MSSYGEGDPSDDFENSVVGDLTSEESPNNEVTPATAEQMSQAAADRARHDNNHRNNLVKWTMWVVSVSLIANFGVFGVYMGSQWHEISDSVMIAWISATVIEVLGIAYIITSDLFKDGSRNR
ncbi:hypothetical protein [Rhodococcus erythropolis]|uniref:hypothetical protein n=1 Tax=Rhodococcus erythropolis TaxID=1833 RepID=UPI001BEB1C7B|nr:hypothetical protein [Rhodococcus erythropolis]MBT2266338.1 hypothetical protein [Rhodococcus erythropolis]